MLGCAPLAFGEEEAQSSASEQAAEPMAMEAVTTRASVTVDGEDLAYTATAGTLPVLDDETGEVRAEVFYIAYTLDDVDDDAERPITFAFNGGPGSSSVWLHMGALGPKRVVFANDKGDAPAPPYDVVENEYTWLKWTDLVFLDPVSTGFSRPAPGVDKKDFHGVEEDASSVGDVIQLYVSRHDRWDSAKWLCGESYGSTRAAAVADYLQTRHGMFLNGVVMVSAAIDFATLRFGNGNQLPYAVFLPTYVATAWYHDMLSGATQQMSLERVTRGAEQWVENAYVPALFQGRPTDEGDMAQLVDDMSQWTGLREDFVRAADARISIWRFTKELLRDERRTVGRLDSRFKGIDADAAGESPSYDPSYSTILGPYTGAVNQYLREDLGVTTEKVYEILTGKVRPWNYDEVATGRYLNVAGRLRDAMNRNEHLRVLFVSGYYDLATPYYATEYVIRQMLLDDVRRDHVKHIVYPAGHMMYLHKPSLVKLTDDVREFYEAAADAQ